MSVLTQLARPGGRSDVQRSRLVTAGLAGAGAVLMAAFAIATVGGDVESVGAVLMPDGTIDIEYSGAPTLARYVSESGLRGGTAFGACLLAVPLLTFAVLALRTGTAARERRLAALSLAGATRSQLSVVAAREGTRAAVRGAVLIVPAYLLLWLLLGVALPRGWRLLPTPTWSLSAVWLVLALALTGLGAAAAVLASDVARVSPLGVSRRIRRPLRTADAVLPSGSVLVIATAVAAWVLSTDLDLVYEIQQGALYLGAIGVLGLALSCGRWLVRLVAGWSTRGGAVGTLAGQRLLADVRTSGRIAGVLMACGVTFAVAGAMIAAVLTDPTGHDEGFFVVGSLAAGAGGVVTALIACGALVVTANEQVLDDRRGIAVLVSLAASPAMVERVVRRQLQLSAVPAAVVGAVLGLVLFVPLNWYALPWALVAVPLSAGVGWAGAVAAARGVRATVRECATPDNLRAT